MRRLLVSTTHPIQYQAPLFRELARRLDLLVLFAHRTTAVDQARAGFGVQFEWDLDLLSGYPNRFLTNVARRPSLDRFFGTSCPEVGSMIRRERPDALLVMGWHHRSYWQAIRAAKRAGVPLLVRGESQLVTPRSGALRSVKRMLYPLMLSAFDAFLYIGERNKQYLQYYGARDSRMFFSPYAVDTHFFRRAASGSDVGTLREKLGIGKAERVVMFCGKVIEKKRPLDVVEALARLPADQRPVLMVVGDGPLRDAMRERARQAGVETRFVGFKNQTELPPYYALADLLVLPSDGGETWGLVVNEAMSCGTPALVSDAVGCGPDLIEPGKTGAVFRLGDIDDLANAIARSIDLKHDPAVQTALERKMAEYSIERAADGIVAAVEALGKRRH